MLSRLAIQLRCVQLFSSASLIGLDQARLTLSPRLLGATDLAQRVAARRRGPQARGLRRQLNRCRIGV